MNLPFCYYKKCAPPLNTYHVPFFCQRGPLRAFFHTLGIPQKSEFKLLPPHSQVSLKSASWTQAEWVGKCMSLCVYSINKIYLEGGQHFGLCSREISAIWILFCTHFLCFICNVLMNVCIDLSFYLPCIWYIYN